MAGELPAPTHPDEREELLALAARLATWRAAPDRPVDITAPGWLDTLRRDGPPRLYARFGPVFPAIQALCRRYALAAPADRATVRVTLGGNRDALHALRQFTPTLHPREGLTHAEWRAGYAAYKDRDFDGWLRALIAALAIQLAQIDYRDDILAIGHLEREARERGADFAPYRRELQRLADPAAATRVGLCAAAQGFDGGSSG